MAYISAHCSAHMATIITHGTDRKVRRLHKRSVISISCQQSSIRCRKGMYSPTTLPQYTGYNRPPNSQGKNISEQLDIYSGIR
ncbi:hypothetical protein Mapa_003127 [Marchantia paleacea]|nr:hypothetical protein Mapa_003127 [Marchantia paleacea]